MIDMTLFGELNAICAVIGAKTFRCGANGLTTHAQGGVFLPMFRVPAFMPVIVMTS